MQHAPCIFLRCADLVALNDVQEVSNWNFTSIFTNYNDNYAKLCNSQIIESVSNGFLGND